MHHKQYFQVRRGKISNLLLLSAEQVKCYPFAAIGRNFERDLTHEKCLLSHIDLSGKKSCFI